MGEAEAASGKPGTRRCRPAWRLGDLWLVLNNFTLVTSGSVTVSTVLALVPLVGLVIGIVRGQGARGGAGWLSAPRRRR